MAIKKPDEMEVKDKYNKSVILQSANTKIDVICLMSY